MDLFMKMPVLIAFVILTNFGVGCATSPVTLQQYPAEKITRDFVDGPYGQVHIRLSRHSPGEHRPLVLLHPTPYSSQFYIPFMKLMGTDRTVIAIDTPGYGDSDHPQSKLSIAEYSENIRIVLDNMGITEPVDILGYHTGALIAADFAVSNTDLVHKAVLAGIPSYPPEKLPELFAEYAKPDVIEKDGSHLDKAWGFATQTMKAGFSLQGSQAHFSDYMQAVPNSSDAYYAVFSYPSYQYLPAMQRPALFVAINGTLKDETLAAQKITPGSDFLYLDHITKGLFDVAYEEMAEITRAYLDE